MPHRTDLVIRRFEPHDERAVREIFTSGLMGLWTTAVKDAAVRPTVMATTLALPVVIGGACYKAGASPAATVAAAAVAAVAVPVSASAYVIYKLWQYVRHSLEDDLAHIPEFYSDAGAGEGSCFWVAELRDRDDGTRRVVGSVALERKSQHSAELRRMSVSRDARQRGVGRQLAGVLVEHARRHGFKTVFLTTTSLQRPALRLYAQLGWREVSVWFGGDFTFHYLELDVDEVAAPGGAAARKGGQD